MTIAHRDELLKKAEQLVSALRADDEDGVQSLLADLTRERESELFREVGRLTRELHDALANFRLDSRFSELAAQDVPEAKDRLQYVMKLTDESANKTLDAVEKAVAIAADVGQRSGNLYKEWQRIAEKRQQPGDFKAFFMSLGAFLPQLMEHADTLNHLMTQALMAQDFQDLTGQVIKRVIELVQDVEDKLVETIRMFGQMEDYRRSMDGESERNVKAEGPILNADKRDDVVSSQDDVDDLLSSLGF